MAFAEERAVAQLMYEQERKTAKDISTQTGVPLQTVYRWIKDLGWKQSKVDRILNKSEQLKNLRELIGKMTDELLSADQPDKSRIDTLRRYQNMLSEFEKTVDVRGTILQGMDAFVRFMRSEHPEAVETFIPYFQEFPTWVRKNYPEIR